MANEVMGVGNGRRLFGRRQIFTDSIALTNENVVDVINNAFTVHTANRIEIDYLYDYYRGKHPILGRKKEIRPEILNKIPVNMAHEAVDFATGYFMGEPIQYVSRNGGANEEISILNTWMDYEGKHSKDKDLVEWQSICGQAYRMVVPNPVYDIEEPFRTYALDPRNAFVVYVNDFRRNPLCGVAYVIDQEGNKTFSVYSDTHYWEISGDKIVVSQPHRLGGIPIIEYPANNARMGIFEAALPLMDALDLAESDRADGLEQAIQSLLVFYNCDLGEDEEGNPMTPHQIREAGAIFLKSFGENKADLKEITSNLDQGKQQTYTDNLRQCIREIVGLPSQGNGNTADSSNNGAVIFKNGWQTAETRAKDREIAFKMCEQQFIKVTLWICRSIVPNFDLRPKDIVIKFTRRNYENIQAKSQVLITMLNCDWIAPIDAFVACGIFSDPEDACRRGMAHHKEVGNETIADRSIESVEIEPSIPTDTGEAEQ